MASWTSLARRFVRCSQHAPKSVRIIAGLRRKFGLSIGAKRLAALGGASAVFVTATNSRARAQPGDNSWGYLLGGVGITVVVIAGGVAYTYYALQQQIKGLKRTLSEEDINQYLEHMSKLGGTEFPKDQLDDNLSQMAILFSFMTRGHVVLRGADAKEIEKRIAATKDPKEKDSLRMSQFLMRFMDHNRDSAVTFKEFLITSVLLARSQRGDSEALADLWFQVLDDDNDGFVTNEELQEWYKTMFDCGGLKPAPGLNKTQITEMVRKSAFEFDSNWDGKLDRKEIIAWIEGLKKKNNGVIPVCANMNVQFYAVQALAHGGVVRA